MVLKQRPVVGVLFDWFSPCQSCVLCGLVCVVGFFGGYGKRGTPGLIPNPVVKALSADGTAPGRCVGE